MKDCNINKTILLDLLCFIAFDRLDESFRKNKLITVNRAKRYFDINYSGRFEYFTDIKSNVITSSFMKEGKKGYIVAYSSINESTQELFDYVVKNKLKDYIDNTIYNQNELTNEIELLIKEFQDGYMKHFSFMNEILLFVCDYYKIKPQLEKPLLIAI
ncbi:TPA: hypothetical protein ACMEXA_005622 [Klebsiella variicola subsp. variicola]|uniref:hypothetical protein n=1 Tax=Klebsiella variicola TaxID=244366 RepID=UPI001CCC58FC|nr:hypothetical protein [Klebsiella variicola]HBQ8857478.1 hypothetical protein [Klebsiella variicola subsp. variicola]HBQ8869319.1 hypothetical protein [Klebsiella pneumoniae]MEC5999720.1 hypothetical protein [Klebsiella variicola]UBN00596.1 hypothetical protein LB484_29475 [Klebsiella variicola]HBQ8863786.1 hypothetical protein [Klebsiella variicola subsp. variicola]